MGQILEWMECEREEGFVVHSLLDCRVVAYENDLYIVLVNSHFNNLQMNIGPRSQNMSE